MQSIIFFDFASITSKNVDYISLIKVPPFEGSVAVYSKIKPPISMFKKTCFPLACTQ